jgi:hypothetical protein
MTVVEVSSVAFVLNAEDFPRHVIDIFKDAIGCVEKLHHLSMFTV